MKGFLLDTNIVSEFQKGERCSPQVRAWYNRSGEYDLFLSVLVLGEIRRGIELRRLKDPMAARALEKRRSELAVDFKDQILPVTVEICDLWGRLALKAPMSVIDGLLAATALYHNLTLVTRNTRDVARSGADCFDPFLS